jgi:molecular chaperone GrpE (heat shock protein)
MKADDVMGTNDTSNVETLKKAIINMAVEAWRFRRVFEKAMNKLDACESARYINQFSWFIKKVDAALEDAGLRIINVEGQAFDVGMAVTPLNMDDFSHGDVLFVEQMLEPIVMDSESVVRTGTVILGRANR